MLTLPPKPTTDKLKDETKTVAITTVSHRLSPPERGNRELLGGGKTVKIEVTYSLNEHIWVLQKFLLCPDYVFFLRQKKRRKKLF